MSWLLISDHPPKPWNRVLVTDGDEVRIGTFDDDEWEWFVYGVPYIVPIYWMPLPEPPNV